MSTTTPPLHRQTSQTSAPTTSQKTAHRVRVEFAGQSVEFGGPGVVVIAGPCSIESESHLLNTGREIASLGAVLLRGGVFKMRTNAASFQGIGEPAFEFLPRAKSAIGLPLVCEVTDPRQIEMMLATVDMFQVGSRNMYNYELLKELGRTDKPVLLKRAFAATVDEWVNAADYVVRGGNDRVVLCERGIRTFETTTRNTLDLNAVAWLKAHTSFPVVVDPSHGTGRRELVIPMALAGIAAGADGIICEVHPVPDQALSDSAQAIDFKMFEELVRKSRAVAASLDRTLAVLEKGRA
ncbi:MAG: 3-deoxy-7-phosphoheptulonate synthase [Bdellovibrionaceae bacterium]|nr:3-deoxy-7-phosphoheptulonate synthase [Pseudobdellovibrionaceae bacterium]